MNEMKREKCTCVLPCLQLHILSVNYDKGSLLDD